MRSATVGVLLVLGGELWAATAAAPPVPVIRALRTTEPIQLDGHLRELSWGQAQPETTFWQREPREGEPATERTEVRLLYDDRALYVGFICYDSQPQAVLKRLTRRDRMVVADWVGVLIDSYLDRQTAFAFLVSAAGAQADFLITQDGQAPEDVNWDAIWEARVADRPDGWSAEFRIPFTSLRFRRADTLRWGINFGRIIGRKNEQVFWAHVPRSAGGFVSRFGLLEGLVGLQPARALELTPYTVGSITRWSAELSPRPLHPVLPSLRWGGDVRYGISSGTTLNLTFNPDFGQVELDEVVLNLTAFETFYPEKRPFFLEGTDIFQTVGADEDGPLRSRLFYSRRIGRLPRGYEALPDTGAIGHWRLVERPSAVPILSAVKLSGKSEGWAFGFLGALTDRTYNTYEHRNGLRARVLTEPLSGYAVGRLRRALPDPGSYLGVIATGTWRELGPVNRAYTGGVDWQWNPGNYRISTQGLFSFSRRLRADRSPQVGYQGQVRLGSLQGRHLVGFLGVQFATPDYDPNDVGFHTMSDFAVVYGWTQARRLRPWGPALRLWLSGNAWRLYTFQSRDFLRWGWNANGYAQWRNFWSTSVGLNLESAGWDPYESRGMGRFRSPRSTNLWIALNTDERRLFSGGLNGSYRRDEYGSRGWSLGVEFVLRPGERTSLQLEPSVSSRRAELAWARNVQDLEGVGVRTSVFGRRDVDRLNLLLRGSHLFTRDLSLQAYLQWFWARGRYRDFQKLGPDGYLQPLALPYDRRRFGDPDFQAGALAINLILRYEYRPGSTLFVVWTWGQDLIEQRSDAEPIPFARRVLGRSPTSVLLFKWTYTWSM
nr:MAG: hypothetical protein KatS3mg041_1099 [Bacteroidota bacterium]